MKSVLLLTLLFYSFTINENVVDRIGVKGPLEFNGTTFKLSWTDKPNDKYYIQEYLPDGEKTDAFNQMLTIHLFDTDMKIEKAVQQKIKELTNRKKKDPICNYQVNESPDGKEFMVDFLLSESKDDKVSIVEFNIYKYKRVSLGENKKGIVVYAYSKRKYHDEIMPFLKGLKDERTTHLNQMISAEIPAITIQDK